MLRTILVLAAICSLGLSSGVGVVPEGVVPAPVVTAASSQYFERTYNRLIAAQPVFEPVIPVAQAPPVVVEPVTRIPVPVNPTQSLPVEPNVAIAVATANAAAPVATILLPPYPFGFPPSFGFVPSVPTKNIPDEERPRESTTKPTTKATTRETEQTTPLPSPSNTDNSFVKPLPSNQQDINFRQYYAPPVVPLPVAKPQKLKTSVEVVPVPLQYIAPPPLALHHHHHHHHGHGHVEPVKIVHAFVPARARIIIRPVSAPLRIRSVTVPARLVAYRPLKARNVVPGNLQNARSRSISRDTEPTTFRPFNRPITKPPKV